MDFKKSGKFILVALFLFAILTFAFAESVSFTAINDHSTNDCTNRKFDGRCSSTTNKCAWDSGLKDGTPLSSDSNFNRWMCPGVCGGANVTCYKLKESVKGECGTRMNTCAKGQYEYSSNGTWPYVSWSCLDGGVYTGGVNCAAPYPVDGNCGPTINECTNILRESSFDRWDKFLDVDDNSTHYKWICEKGTSPGKDVNCSKPKVLNPVCGTDHNICTSGTVVSVADNVSELLWSCKVNSTTTVKCLKGISYADGQCSSTVQTCMKGVFFDVKDTNTQYFWTCKGTGGGNNQNCSAYKPDLEACADYLNGCIGYYGVLEYLPSSNSSDDNSTHYIWYCPAVRGTLICSKAKSDLTACGTKKDTCAAGYYKYNGGANLGNKTEYIWACLKTNPTTGLTEKSVKCINEISYSAGVCGIDINSCASGTLGKYYYVSSSSNYYEWKCIGSKEGPNASIPAINNASCSAEPFDGLCGSIRNSCLRGELRDVSEGDTYYSWKCNAVSSLGSGDYCFLNKSSYSCIGAVPSNANLCSGDNSGLDSNLTNIVVSNCSLRKCEYICNSGYSLLDGVCSPVVNGVCGTEVNSCANGTFLDTIDSFDLSRWSCVGSNTGTTASCTKAIPAKVNGVCSTTLNVCTSGTFVDVNDSTTQYKWNCNGLYGGTTASCTKTIPAVNGVCGADINSCTLGTFVDVSDSTTQFKWGCKGLGAGTTASCTKVIPVTAAVNGSCSSSLDVCTKGTFVDVDDNATHGRWSCVGANGGTTASCAKLFVRNGSCGTELNSCVTGTLVDIVDGTTLAKWNCVGSGGGTTVSCSKAIAAVNGVCGVVLNSCVSGSFVETADAASEYRWNCAGAAGGVTVNCKTCDKGTLRYNNSTGKVELCKVVDNVYSWIVVKKITTDFEYE
jgi:hypothetical protein